MNRKLKVILFFLFFYFFFFPKNIFAQVVINEFSSSSSADDWVEIYNLGEPFDTSILTLVDETGNRLDFPSCMLSQNGTYAIGWSNKLNYDGDRVFLFKDGAPVDCVAYGDGTFCDDKTSVDLSVLISGEYGARQPEGTGSWVKTASPSKSNNSYCLPTATLTPIPTLTPTPTPQTKAIYKINKPKDNNGNTLSSVKIYVDNLYTHHEDDEILIFCSNCYCDNDKNVACGLGEHTIKLEKEGYSDWSESKNFNAGDNFEASPVLSSNSPTNTPIPTNTLTLTPTLTPKPTNTPSLSPTPTIDDEESATESSELENTELEIGSAESDLISLDGGQVKGAETKRNKFNIWPFLIIAIGAGMIGFSIFSFVKQKKVNL